MSIALFSGAKRSRIAAKAVQEEEEEKEETVVALKETKDKTKDKTKGKIKDKKGATKTPEAEDETEERTGEEEEENGDVPKTFAEMGLPKWILRTCEEMGYVAPTPVQSSCIPQILMGKNVVGNAETGSGKTAAFALPILQRLSEDPSGIFALILTPTRELAIQISEQLTVFGAKISLRFVLVIGGLSPSPSSLPPSLLISLLISLLTSLLIPLS